METVIKILVKRVKEKPEVVKVENALSPLQDLVKGYLETVQLNRDIIMVVNEEGKLLDLENNFHVISQQRILDTVVGNAFFVSSEGAEFTSLSDKQIETIQKALSNGYLDLDLLD